MTCQIHLWRLPLLRPDPGELDDDGDRALEILARGPLEARMEVVFALASEADPETLDLYGRTAGNLRRLLEAVGLRRRAKDVGPTLSDILRGPPP